MGSEDFKPLWEDFVKKENQKDENREEEDCSEVIKELLKEREELLKTIRYYEEKIDSLEEEKRKLHLEIKNREEAIKKLEEKLSNLLERGNLSLNLSKSFEKYLSNLKEEYREKVEEFLRAILLEFSYYIPQVKVLKEELRNIIDEIVKFKTNLKLYVNPEDLRYLNDEIKSLKENLRSEGVSLQVLEDKEIKRGSFKIKGEHFTVERDPKEFAKILFEKVFGDVFKRD
ncbi:MAG: hypothetical protein DSY32_01135 [Aquifex sp.]|nr:MAG: hypothetical protein DSY32_01135 [Aquifex sp.]